MILQQYQLAQCNLRQMYAACNQVFNRNGSRMRKIEHNYEELWALMKCLHTQHMTKNQVTTEWHRTEVANAAYAIRVLNREMWAVVTERNKEADIRRQNTSIAHT